jgi:predicted glycoside hydrolase/deacetylase ChbG (UPF0249 family)
MKISPNARPIILCADDFGIAPGVSDAIAQLISGGRLSATSCMTTMPDWRRQAPALRAIVRDSPADVGLHLTLTDHAALARSGMLAERGRLPPLGRLLKRAMMHALDRRAIADELTRQLEAFEDAWGAAPDYVDGHQHVHVLPGVREVLVETLRHRYPPDTVWVRDCVEHPATCLRRGVALPKALFISALGYRLRRLLRENHLPSNAGFSGLHDFSGHRPFGELMRRFLANPGPRPLVHVHPGRVDASLLACDSLTTTRERELAYLCSDEFEADLAAASLRPARYSAFTTGAVAG